MVTEVNVERHVLGCQLWPGLVCLWEIGVVVRVTLFTMMSLMEAAAVTLWDVMSEI